MSDNKNQPAFPFSDQYFQRNDAGLSKREYIAIEAMKGILSNAYLMQISAETVKPQDHYTFLSQAAVKHADALIAELNNPTQQPKNP